jgi:hypothetical protein
LTITFTKPAVGSYSFAVTLTDKYNASIQSSVLKLVVVNKNTNSYTLSYNQDQYSLYVDNELVDGDFELFEGQTYSVKYVAYDGYNINSVTINGVSSSTSATQISSVSTDYKIEAKTIEQSTLTINFISDYGDIYVDGQKLDVAYYSVARDSDLSFKITSKEGYAIRKVTVDGETITANNGVYTISDITSSKVVTVTYDEAYYLIEITFVNACGSYVVGNGGNLENVGHGSSREITISANEGYEVDFVSVNGSVINVKNGTFVISDIDDDQEVVVSFTQKKTSIFSSENSSIVYYFLVFLGIFVAFVIGKVCVHLYNKKRKM